MNASGLILVIDDHEIMRDLLERNLRNQGYDVITAANGRVVFDIVRRYPIDLILLDVMMPEMNGIEVLIRLKADAITRSLPVVMLSADNDTERVASCINLGADDYLVKPFDPVVLKARVGASIERYRLRAKEREYQTLLEQRVAERTADLERSEQALRHQTAILEAILNSMGDGVVVVDTAGDLLHANPAANEILGAHLPALLPTPKAPVSPFQRTDHPTFLQSEDLPLASAIHGQRVTDLDVSLISVADAEQRWLSITANPLREVNGLLIGGVAVVRDVSAARRSAIALRESEERYTLAARGANDGLWDWDLQSGRIYFSPRWKAMLGYPEHEIGSCLEEWLSRVHPDDREPLESRLAAHHARLISHFEHEYRIMHRDGTYRWMLCRGLAVWDAVGRALRMAGSQTDITSRKHVEQQLLHDAFHDGLTDLPNRALFVDRLQSSIMRSRRHSRMRFAVLFCDLDRFKVINDSLGHAAGDKLLITIAQRLLDCVRPGDTIARLGGDEFTILLEDVQDDLVAWTVANRIQAAVFQPLMINGQEVFTTASIGILMSEPGYDSAVEMIRDADIAMYCAKMEGRGRAVLFTPTMHAAAMERLEMESDLRWAVERDELRLHYQPIVALDTGQIVGLEALIRWEHPRRGLLFPADFLHIAEESGLISSISWWVLRAAAAQVAMWQREMPSAESIWVSVNLSAHQLAEPDMLARTRDILEETGLPPHCLKLEITEHTLVAHGDATIQTLTHIRELGVQLCIDDFGTGYSSLSYLQRFPLDVLKIDRSFISQLGQTGTRSEIVQTILNLARNLGMQAVAEGTETVQQVDELRRLACEYGQGWLFSRALDASAITALMNDELMLARAPLIQ